MSLNLYDILLEVVGKDMLNEDVVTPAAVTDAINKKVIVKIHYDDQTHHATGTRFIEPFAYGVSKAGNDVLRAFQVETGPNGSVRGAPKWKLFRLDRITDWKPTKTEFQLTPDQAGWANAFYFNQNGDGSMTSVKAIADMGDWMSPLEIEKAKTKMRMKGRAFNTRRMEGDLPDGFRRRKPPMTKKRKTNITNNMEKAGPYDWNKWSEVKPDTQYVQPEESGPSLDSNTEEMVTQTMHPEYSQEELKKMFPEYFSDEKK